MIYSIIGILILTLTLSFIMGAAVSDDNLRDWIRYSLIVFVITASVSFGIFLVIYGATR